METSTSKPEKNKGGRPQNSHNKMSQAAREAAQATGRLPHEILLDIARGNPQTLKVPQPDGSVKEQLVGVSLEEVRDAAKAAAPYYAPKISTVEVITGVSDADLDELITRAATEAGISLGSGGEGAQEEAEGLTRPARRRVKLLDDE